MRRDSTKPTSDFVIMITKFTIRNYKIHDLLLSSSWVLMMPTLQTYSMRTCLSYAVSVPMPGIPTVHWTGKTYVHIIVNEL